MHNAKYIVPGIIVFIVLATLPFWWNVFQPAYEPPTVALPADKKECIEPVDVMRAEHFVILDVWRDAVVRDGARMWTASDGEVWNMSLQNTCMDCHTNKEEFCDTCHASNGVDPYCWDCHVAPRGNQQ